MVIASSRDAYPFTVNSYEQKAFARLCDTFALDQDTQNELIVEAKNELAKRPGLLSFSGCPALALSPDQLSVLPGFS